MKEEILNFLNQFINVNEIEHHTNFIEEGMVNSLFAMQLILFLEEKFGIQIPNEDIKQDNFCSIDSIMHYLENNCPQ